ncbi:MAG TPA: hypothetical protein VGI78_09120 [Acetobacteraceae bacterium]
MSEDFHSIEAKHRHRHFSIELDCAPGNPRPGDLIAGVLEGTGLVVADFDTGNPFFGHQVWVLKVSEQNDPVFTAAKPVLKQRIEALHARGLIRYGSW